MLGLRNGRSRSRGRSYAGLILRHDGGWLLMLYDILGTGNGNGSRSNHWR